MTAVSLADLHLHIYGCIRHDALLRHLIARDVDWSRYEALYQEAFGTYPPIREILERHRQDDPTAAADFRQLFIFGGEDVGNFQRFLAKFALVFAGSEAVRLPDADMTELLREMAAFTAEIGRDQHAEGIGYAEIRMQLGATCSPDTVDCLVRALVADYTAMSHQGVITRAAPSLPRENPWPQWEVIQRIALEPQGACLTGVDFCHIEAGFPPKDKADFFQAVHEHNRRHPTRALALLYHVGENYDSMSLESAIRWVQEAAEMGVHRLGHAIALGVNPQAYGPHTRTEAVGERLDTLRYDLQHAAELARYGVRINPAAVTREMVHLATRAPTECMDIVYDDHRLHDVRQRQEYAMQRVRSAGSVIEVCPSSNVRIAGLRDPAHHPVVRFLAAGLKVVVASDDPGLLGIRLVDEIDWVVRLAGMDDAGRHELIRNAWRYRSEVLTGREPATVPVPVG